MSLIYKDANFFFPKPGAKEKITGKLSPLKYEKLRAEVFSDQDEKCLDCGKKFETLPEMDLHHLTKRKMGGGSRNDARKNVVGLCRKCHQIREGR